MDSEFPDKLDEPTAKSIARAWDKVNAILSRGKKAQAQERLNDLALELAEAVVAADNGVYQRLAGEWVSYSPDDWRWEKILKLAKRYLEATR